MKRLAPFRRLKPGARFFLSDGPEIYHEFIIVDIDPVGNTSYRRLHDGYEFYADHSAKIRQRLVYIVPPVVQISLFACEKSMQSAFNF